ncbi:hypothetical protein IEQ34_022513 [Dendrobium chrysotoxum]|uniref:Trehalase n=1 Tax=Dendrobium chrysotoxum TaxID=161865 RepID=A0AAV7FZ95_DENCH|nr:hypothetical protein IEQ34_022513 [Dendrobium chrysotoxum]
MKRISNPVSKLMAVTKHLPKMPSHSFNFFSFLFSVLLVISVTTTRAAASSSCAVDDRTYSTTPLVSFLQRLQSEALKTLGPNSFDPKLYVDLPLKKDLSLTEAAFWKLPRVKGIIPENYLHRFLEAYFGDAGEDLVYTEPEDFVPEPEGFLPKVFNPKVRAWALEVHSLWKNLSRRVSDNVKSHPERHTLLPLPEPLIIPGSRFREVYYWDSYWIIRGLLVSKMYDTAKAIVNNLVWLVDAYGHVPNGARVYYASRSQPPLLSSMVMEIYTRTGDLEFVRKSLPSLIKEYTFWNSGIHKVTIQDLHGHKHSLSRYYARWNKPRPESATIDEESASKFLNDSDREAFFREVASTAETGWDFSSRWMSNSYDLSTLSTTSIIPVDLNTYLYKEELDIAFFAQKLGDIETYEKFIEASNARQFAMRSIFWNAEMNQWLDYWIRSDDCEDVHQFDVRNQNDRIFASNFIPIWNWRLTSGLGEHSVIVERIYESFLKSGLLQPAGIATSVVNNGQQWDFPNGWSPLQHIIIEGLSTAGSKASYGLAQDIAVRWIRTNYAAYNTTGAMHEKYDVEGCGKVGGGGEYKPQTGFGWSNGVLLALLEEFGWSSDRDIECSS